MEDRVGKILVFIIVCVVGFIGYACFFEATHHCTKSHTVTVSGEVVKDIYGVFKYIPAHEETRCDQYERN